MGNAFICKVDDPNAAFYNPAGLGTVRRTTFHLTNLHLELNKGFINLTEGNVEDLVDKLGDNGVEVTHMMGAKVGHMFHRTPDWKMETFKVSDQFLIEKGILKGKPTAKNTGNQKLVMID